MWKRWYLEAMLVAGLFLLSACSLMDMGKAKPAQQPAPPATVQTPTPAPITETPKPAPAPAPASPMANLPGDQDRLQAALNASDGVVKYQVVLATDPSITDKTAYLDTLAAPANNELLVVLFPEAGYDVRFAMGAVFWENEIKVDDMLGWVRAQYLPAAREGKPATGLAALIEAINQHLAL